MQAPPLAPQLVGDEVMQVFPEQQPLAQKLALQNDAAQGVALGIRAPDDANPGGPSPQGLSPVTRK